MGPARILLACAIALLLTGAVTSTGHAQTPLREKAASDQPLTGGFETLGQGGQTPSTSVEVQKLRLQIIEKTVLVRDQQRWIGIRLAVAMFMAGFLMSVLGWFLRSKVKDAQNVEAHLRSFGTIKLAGVSTGALLMILAVLLTCLLVNDPIIF